MKFVFFSVSENGENGLSDEGADGGSAPTPRMFGLEPPLVAKGKRRKGRKEKTGTVSVPNSSRCQCCVCKPVNEVFQVG